MPITPATWNAFSYLVCHARPGLDLPTPSDRAVTASVGCFSQLIAIRLPERSTPFSVQRALHVHILTSDKNRVDYRLKIPECFLRANLVDLEFVFEFICISLFGTLTINRFKIKVDFSLMNSVFNSKLSSKESTWFSAAEDNFAVKYMI